MHGNAGEMGKYAVLSILPDKIARYLYEFHHTWYGTLGLPAIPLDRSDVDVHGILRPDQVLYAAYIYHTCICLICLICIICESTLIYAIYVSYCIYCIFYIF